ncbi:MAG TPA: outer membrane beta-barrel protein, partial [Puia sp.]
ELIKQKADQYKLYPSEKVWKRIYSSLHTGRRWFITGMALLITGILFLAGKGLLVPDKHLASVKKQIDTATINPSAETEKNNIARLPIAPNFNPENNNSQKANRDDDKSAITNPVILSGILAIDNPLNANTATGDNSSTNIPGKINAQINSTDNSLVLENFPLVNNVVVTDDVVKPGLTSDAELNESIAKEEMNKINWLQENASYAIPKQARKSRFQLQEYSSPTASFRTLSGGGNYNVPKSNVQNIPIASTHLGSPNDYVDHKPAAGVEFGASIVYRLTRNIAIKTGLQFNYSRYTIEAYSSYNPQPATITLNSVYGYTPNSITSYTNVQNFGGNSKEALQNQYFDFSAPIGLEIKVLGNEKLQLNIAATIEPTYLLNRNSYLLATDYSNYIKDPTLFRRWNYNGGVEAFVSYKIGQFRLQAGPQFRYQLLSTFVGQYPIKENLKEYGLKIGLTKSIW